jgi:polar amino acid transport system permease protein
MRSRPASVLSAGQRPAESTGSRILPPRRSGQAVSSAIALLAVAVIANVLVTNGNFHWDIVRHYLFSSTILAGVGMTLALTGICMAIGSALGTALAVMRRSQNRLVAALASAYIWFFRGTPVLVQLVFWYNLATLFPQISIGIPFGGPTLVHAATNTLIRPFTAAVLGLGLNEGAYMAEIVRGGIQSIDAGQSDAGRALGMTHLQIMRRVVLPQAMRAIIPPTANETIGMLKMTSLVSVISLADLLYSAQLIYSVNFQTIPLLLTASVWYLIITTVLTVAQSYLERRFSRGFNRAANDRRVSFSLLRAGER